ncbi:MAG TPA: DUF3040 domain-containing protein, partial [Streptosporangiaceae bacterium]
MPMSEYEERRWRELEAQLAQERRLVALARRVGSVRPEPRDSAAPRPRTRARIPSRTYFLWALGGSLGLILVLLGGVTHNALINTAGIIVLTGSLVLVGVALIAVGLTR